MYQLTNKEAEHWRGRMMEFRTMWPHMSLHTGYHPTSLSVCLSTCSAMAPVSQTLAI